MHGHGKSSLIGFNELLKSTMLPRRERPGCRGGWRRCGCLAPCCSGEAPSSTWTASGRRTCSWGPTAGSSPWAATWPAGRARRARARRSSSTSAACSSSPAASTPTPTCTCRSERCGCQRRLRHRHGRGRGRRHHHRHRLRHRRPRRATRSAALATWRRWAEPAAVDVGLHMTFTEAVPEARRGRLHRAGRHHLQALHGLPASRCRSTTTSSSTCSPCAKRHGGLVTVHAENGGAITALRRQALADGRTGVFEHSHAPGPRCSRARPWPAPTALAEVAEAPDLRGAHVVGARRWRRCGPPRSAAWRLTARPARSTSSSTPTASPTPTARTSSAPRRCATRGTARSCGRDSPGAGCTPSPPTTARSGSPTATPACRAGRRAGRTSPRSPAGCPASRPGSPSCGHGVRAGRSPVADWVRLCAEAPARTFGLWPRKGCLRAGRRRRRRGVGPAPHARALDADALHMRGRPLAVRGARRHRVAGAGAVAGPVVARDGQFCGEAGWGRYVARGTPDVYRSA